LRLAIDPWASRRALERSHGRVVERQSRTNGSLMGTRAKVRIEAMRVPDLHSRRQHRSVRTSWGDLLREELARPWSPPGSREKRQRLAGPCRIIVAWHVADRAARTQRDERADRRRRGIGRALMTPPSLMAARSA